MPLGLVFDGLVRIDEFPPLAQEAEELRPESVWVQRILAIEMQL